MKNLSNTSIAAVFAAGLTLLVALMLQIPFFADKETQTADEMLLLRYWLHQKYAPIKPDPTIVLAAIDQKSVDSIGRWPFSRQVHGDFLLLLAPEKPREVGWDITFEEREKSTSLLPGNSNQAADTAPAPAADAPAPATVAPAPATPPDMQAAPTPAPAPPPDSAPSPPSTNAPPTTAPPTQPAPSSAANFIPGLISIGADEPANTPNPTSAATTTPPPATANAATPAPPAPSTDAAPPAPSPAPATPSLPPGSIVAALPPPSPYLLPGDQHFVNAASQFPKMVTGDELSQDQQIERIGADHIPVYADESEAGLLPTRPFKHVTGDITKLLSAPHAHFPYPELRKETYFGFVNENGETGGGVRRKDPLAVNLGGRVLPNLDLQILMQYWGIDPDQVTIDLGHEITLPRPDGTVVHIPIDESAQLTINYRAKLDDFQEGSYINIVLGLQDKLNGQQSDERSHLPLLKDALVIVGVTISGTDAGATPLDNLAPAPLVVTHLNALNTILQQDFLKPVSAWIWMPLYALFLFGTGALMLRVGIAPMIPISLLALIILAMTSFAALYFGNYVLPVAAPELGILLLAGAVPTKRFFGEEREKLRVRKAMGTYLSPKVMDKILAHPDGVKLGGVKQEITIMFCDIRGFTAYCDNRDPQEVLTVVNEYFEEMTQVVFKYEGTVDKYIGDCIMAFWNAPDDQPDHAQRAVCCAMEMRYALANFKVKRAGLDTELFECGIGIHTGEALVGNMGSTLKVNYTAMGSTVNLGARLESLTKNLNERILISQATRDALTGDFPITDRGEAIIPGFANPIHVYGVGAEQDLGSAIQVGLKLAKKQEYTAEEVTKPIWAPAPLPEDADPNHGG